MASRGSRSSPAAAPARNAANKSAEAQGRTVTKTTPAKTEIRGDLSIGQLAELTQVSTRTIRYYEELGILPPPQRTSGGTRRYPRDYVFYVEGARLLKELGFGLEEIAELGKFALTGAAASKRTQAILKDKLSELEHRIRVLNRLHELVVEATTSRKPVRSSPVPALLRWVSEESGRSKIEAS